MPTYNASAVADGVIAFQKPITLQQGRALRDNPIAIVQGAAGAPKIYGVAAANDANGGLAVLTVTASSDYLLMQGHNYEEVNAETTGTGYVLLDRYTLTAYTGSVRLSLTMSPFGTGEDWVVHKNAVSIFSGVVATASLDVAISPGDVLEFYARTATGSPNVTLVTQLQASNAYQPVSLYAPVIPV